MGAALAYYTLFSIAPLLIIAIAIAGLLFGQEAARGEIVAQIQGLIGREGAIAVQGLLKSTNEPARDIFAMVKASFTGNWGNDRDANYCEKSTNSKV